jgi:hypothetical protein
MMKHPIFRFLPVFIFLGVALLAIIRDNDYVEAGIWSCFAVAMVVPALPFIVHETTKRTISVAFMVIGLILLLLRLSGVLPVPVKPLPSANSELELQNDRP